MREAACGVSADADGFTKPMVYVGCAKDSREASVVAEICDAVRPPAATRAGALPPSSTRAAHDSAQDRPARVERDAVTAEYVIDSTSCSSPRIAALHRCLA